MPSMRLFVKSCRGDQDFAVPKGANSGQGEGRRDEERGRRREQKSSRKVAKTLRRNCAKFVGISAEIRQLPPSPPRTEQPHFSKGGRDEGRTALGDLTYHGNSPGRALLPSLDITHTLESFLGQNVGLIRTTKNSKTERRKWRKETCYFSFFRPCAQFPPAQHPTLSRRLLSLPLPSPGNGQFVFIPVAA